jgi:lipoprotein-releasing system permease protein
MYRTFLSWRYLMARRTNLIGIVGILVGVGALILILSIMSGFLEESRKTLRGSLSDVIVSPSPLVLQGDSPRARSAEPVLERVRSDPRVQAATPHLVWGAMLTQEGVEGGLRTQWNFSGDGAPPFVQLIGIDVESEFETTELRRALSEVSPAWGSGIRVEDVEHPFAPWSGYRGDEPWSWIVVGEGVAHMHGLRRGSLVNLVTVIPDPETGAIHQANRHFLVGGTFRTGENEVDYGRVYLDRRELSDFLGGTSEYSEVLVRLRDYARDAASVCADLTEELLAAGLIRGRDGREVRTWEQYKQNLLGAIENEKVLLGIMLSLVLVVAGFTVFAILSMLVTEKRRDIGVLTALGATPRGILRLYLMIAFWDALIGSTLGAVVGVLGAWNIDDIEKWLSSTLRIQIFNRRVYLFDHIPAVVDPLGVVLIVAGAALPPGGAPRLHPIDALRYE